MKLLGLVAVLIISSAFAGEELRSKKLRAQICGSVLYKANNTLDHEEVEFDEKKCVRNASIKIDKTISNSTLDQVVIMQLTFKFEDQEIVVVSDVELKKVINFNSNGEIVSKWSISDVQIDLTDNRDFEAMLDSIFNEWDSVNVGNGDLYSNTPEVPVTLESIEQLFDEIQSDTDCTFYADYDVDSVLSELGRYSDRLESILDANKDQIKYAALLAYEDGESEYCSLWYFKIVLKSGKVLYIDIDYTT